MINYERLKKFQEKLSNLLEKYQNQKNEISILKEENKKLKYEFKEQFKKIIKFKEENELLKTANAILGSKKYKKLMKNKIDFLIKEIDRSIDQIKM